MRNAGIVGKESVCLLLLNSLHDAVPVNLEAFLALTRCQSSGEHHKPAGKQDLSYAV